MKDLGKALNEAGPKMTLEDLYRDGGFDGGHSFFFTILAEDTELKDSNGSPTVIGFALNSYVYSWDGRTIYMRNFLVHDSYRSKGVSKLIFEGLLKHAKEKGCNRIEIHVSDWNKAARKFYERMGAINVSERDGHVYYRLFKDVIDKMNHNRPKANRVVKIHLQLRKILKISYLERKIIDEPTFMSTEDELKNVDRSPLQPDPSVEHHIGSN
ncbi:Thialysine N-epsilon-acetyltransferase [Pseudolycoriella hygida]|uniref:Thialysine N-epsilon-acetyltransferase n=1 Tax=Pseudolycoriella hygida TaxID=35572 RepID=A0A9Q0NDQ6_9DIPT|nr:Thialysine N-epsilon-acetyltransferase [Pseudolycoriella hygida]